MFQLVLAGLLALPALLLAVLTAPLMALLAAPSLFLLLFRKEINGKAKAIPDHVVITGGSSGIGLCVAKECVQRGISKVTLLARNPAKLKQAQDELEALVAATSTSQTKLQTISVSVSDMDAISKVAQQIVTPAESTILFHCAGISYTTYYQEIDPGSKYMELIQTNQLGVMYTTRAFLKYMEQGLIVMTSSAAGQVGCFGYTGYSPTKFALRGFAEALHQELVTSDVNVQLVFPADTDTPGYREEVKMMPAETKALNDAAGLTTPEDTAKHMIHSAFTTHPSFLVYFNFEAWMLTNLTAGMSPVTTLKDALSQVALGGLFRFISLFYLNDWWRMFRNIHAAKRTLQETEAAALAQGKTEKKD